MKVEFKGRGFAVDGEKVSKINGSDTVSGGCMFQTYATKGKKRMFERKWDPNSGCEIGEWFEHDMDAIIL